MGYVPGRILSTSNSTRYHPLIFPKGRTIPQSSGRRHTEWPSDIGLDTRELAKDEDLLGGDGSEQLTERLRSERAATHSLVGAGGLHLTETTTMSNHRCLAPELRDHIVDLLHDDHETLKQCCLVSKSWVSRTRKHLFAAVRFNTPVLLEAWKGTFPDPSNSPAHHTRTLRISCLGAISAADAAEGGWIPTFSGASCLEVFSYDASGLGTSLTPLHKFSPTLKSLHLTTFSFRPSQIIDLVTSFPLLEDLSLLGYDRGPHEPRAVRPPSNSPPLTGTLELRLIWGVSPLADQLLDLSNGLRFRKLKVRSYHTGDPPFVGKLVQACSGTLEHLDIQRRKQGAFVFHFSGELVINLNFDL